VALAGPLAGSSTAAAECALGWILIIAGAGERGYPLMLRHAGRDAPARSADGELAPARLGLFACWMEDYATARRELERAVLLARECGLVSNLPLALGALGELEFRLGNWIAARAHAEAALRLAEDADQFLHFGHTVLLMLAAARGDEQATRVYADVVATIADHSESRTLEMHAHAGRGLLELGLDRPETAILHQSRTREIAVRSGVGEPNYVQWAGDLIESQIRAGLEDDARVTLAELEAQAQATGRGWALGAAARCRGLLSPIEDADAVFAQARHMVSPFERARTELCWGERLRRDGRRVDARAHLHEAHRAFDSLGALPWAEKAARELRASGGRAQRGPRARSRELTAQEAQIATMVTEGNTNKTIATALFLSPKTIEFHLGHIYRKLEVSNRTQLAHALLTH
jgi:DNA-binding CsgD family transcriptional regulator